MISAAKHWGKDEGLFEKIFILEIMFEYYFNEMYYICQGPLWKESTYHDSYEHHRKFRRS